MRARAVRNWYPRSARFDLKICGFSCRAIVAVMLVCAVPGELRAANPSFQTGFPVAVNGERVQSSSIALGDLNNDGLPDIVVGGIDGKVHAYTGAGVKLWEYDTGSMGISGKAAIADIDADGSPEVVIGAGSTSTANSHGGLYVISHTGEKQCDFQTGDFQSDGWRDGVYSSPAVAELDFNDQGQLEIAFGAWDAHVRVLNHDCTVVWEKYVRDSVWSSPAIGDIDGDGDPEIVIGVDSHHEPFFGTEDGGILHVYHHDGTELTGFPIQIDEVIFSSPALGDIDGDGYLDIVVGTGRCWSNPACAPLGNYHLGVGEYINAWNRNGNALTGWPVDIPGTYAIASPALGDLDGDGVLDVVINTVDPTDVQGGEVHALSGDGSALPGWPVRPVTPADSENTVSFSTPASPIIADLTGDGLPEVILASNWELVVWDASGDQLSRSGWPPGPSDYDLATRYTVASSSAVVDVDGDDDVELIVGGAGSTGSPGNIYAWDFGADRDPSKLWPGFRRDGVNHAIVLPGLLFVDEFESGDTTSWSSGAP